WPTVPRDPHRFRSVWSLRSEAWSRPSPQPPSSPGSSSSGGAGVVRRPSERVQALTFVAILIAAIAGLYATAQVLQPATVPVASVRSVRLDIDGSGWSIHYAPERTTNNTAFGILLEGSAVLAFSVQYQVYEIPKGVFVLGINGSMNGDGGRYWQYWVNGTYGTVAADHQGLGDGDVVQWTFSTPSEGG